MGQKINPIAVRLNFNRFSNSSWFSDYYYSGILYQDLNFRQYLSSIKQPTGNKLGFRTAKCIIHHFPKRSIIHLFCLSDSRKKESGRTFESVTIRRTEDDPRLKQGYEKQVNLTPAADGQWVHLTGQSTLQKSSSYREGESTLWRSPFYGDEGNTKDSHFTSGNRPKNLPITKDSTPVFISNCVKISDNYFDASQSQYWLKSSILQKKKALVNLYRGIFRLTLPEKGSKLNLKVQRSLRFDQYLIGSSFDQSRRFRPGWLLHFLNSSYLPWKGDFRKTNQLLSAERCTMSEGLPEPMYLLSKDSDIENLRKNQTTDFFQGLREQPQKHHTVQTSLPLQLKDKLRGKRDVNLWVGSFFQFEKTSVLSSAYFVLNLYAMHYYFIQKTNSFYTVNNNKENHFLTASTFDKMKLKKFPTFPLGQPAVGMLAKSQISKSLDFYLSNVNFILSQNTKTFISLRPIKVQSIFQCAFLISQEVACKLEQKKSFRFICRLIFQQIASYNYIKGIRVACSGRLNGAEIAKTECRKFGETSLHVFSDKIDYAQTQASTPYGILGVKVWISYS